MTLTVFSNSPPGGRCTLYARYADTIARVFDDVSVNVAYPGKNPGSGPAAPALAIGNRVVAPSDGVIVAPDDIAHTLAEIGVDGAAECLTSLERVQEEFLSAPISSSGVSMLRRTAIALALAAGLLAAVPACSADNAAVTKALEEYLDFVDYGGATIFPEQIPAEEWKKIFVIDARDADQFAKDHIPGAVNIEWRQVVARRGEIPRDRMVLLYCNTGSLSAQAHLALRLSGYDNVRLLQDGFTGWKAKGGFEANARATKPVGH